MFEQSVTVGTKRTKRFWLIGLAGFAVAVVGALGLLHHFHRTLLPGDAWLDIQAGLHVRHSPHPVEAFLARRYGPMNVAANRDKAFLDFFNVDHIKGLRFIARHMPKAKQKQNTEKMAQWIAQYREMMTPEEKQALRAQIDSAAGLAMIRRATAQYMSQDIRYRAATAPVIEQLMTTLAAIRNP